MGTTVGGRRFGWVTWLVYPVLWGPLWLLYRAVNRVYGTEAPEGNLSLIFWLLVLLYFVLDVLLALGLNLLGRILTASDKQPEEPFWYLVSEIVPVWFLLHLGLLFDEYPVSTRLEGVGLGTVRIIAFTAFMISFAAALFRWKTLKRAGAD